MRRARDVRKATRTFSRTDRSADRHSFPCALACTECGWLETPQHGGDPMRTDMNPDPRPCRRCGALAWADLAEVELSRALVASEPIELSLRRGIGTGVLQACGTVVIGSVVASAALVGLGGLLTGICVIALAGMGVGIGRTLVAGLATPRRTAWRWRAPVRRFRCGRIGACGTLEGEGLVHSPLTGLAGVAYRIEVRYPGDSGDAFALVEQGAAPLRMGGVALAHEPTIAIPGREVEMDPEMLRRYLQSRGVDPYAGAIVRETVIAPGTEVVLRRDALGGPPIVCKQ